MTDLDKSKLAVRQSSSVALRKTANLMALTRSIVEGKHLVSEESLNRWLHELWEWADKNNIPDAVLPRDKARLLGMTKLDLPSEELTSLPESLGNLTGLEMLSLWGNQLTSLPESLGNLTRLKILSLGGNKLTPLPDFLSNLTGLETLSLGKNQLTSLPESLGNLTGNE